jgi:hypothetical protein
MRRWGILVTLFYAIAVAALIVPAGALLAGFKAVGLRGFYAGMAETPLFWVWLAVLVGGEGMLLFLSVDTSARRLRPRQHVIASVATIAGTIAVLCTAAIFSVLAALSDKEHARYGSLLSNETRPVLLLLVLWLFWAGIFHLYAKTRSIVTSRAVGWLLKGSVLELLIAVPCHVVARRREDCSAPMVTSYGIATGLAVMLLSFGPGVFILFNQRMQQYRRPIDAGGQSPSR